MRSIIFDSGPIISLTTNNLLWLLKPFKERYKGHFHITNYVKKEIVDKPLTTKRFKFEALQVMNNIKKGVLEVVGYNEIKETTNKLLELANNSFKAYGNYIKIVHPAEISSIACLLHFKGQAFVVDERTTRVLIENPKKLVNILRHSLHTNIKINDGNLNEFRKMTKRC